jgi:hypothetical protein
MMPRLCGGTLTPAEPSRRKQRAGAPAPRAPAPALTDADAPSSVSFAAAKRPGDPIPGRYILTFAANASATEAVAG